MSLPLPKHRIALKPAEVRSQLVQVANRLNGDADPLDQYVYDIRYIDAPAVRFHDGNTDGDLADEADNTLYATSDANFNVTALVDGDSEVVQRQVFTAYGQRMILDADWSAVGDGYQWSIGHQGLMHDAESGLIYNRARYLHSSLGRFVGRDPAGYVDGGSLYEYVRSSVITYVDPSGTQIGITCNARKKMEEYLKSKNITGYDITTMGKTDYYYSKNTKYNKNNEPSDSEIVGSMIKSERVFSMAGGGENDGATQLDNLSKHVKARKAIVSAATTETFEFAVGDETKFNQDHWQGNTLVPQLPPKSTPYDAVRDAWNNPTKYATACTIATALAFAKGTADVLEKDGFNNAWGGAVKLFVRPVKTLIDFVNPQKSSLIREYLDVEKDDWIPGDWGYIENPSKDKKLGQEGENIIYVGNDKYWGFGVSPSVQSSEAWRKVVAGWNKFDLEKVDFNTTRLGTTVGLRY